MSTEKVRYDSESDLLSVYKPDSKIKREVDVGDMVIQFNRENKVVGFEMLNASDFLILQDESIDKREFLKSIKSADMSIQYTENAIQIVAWIQSNTSETSAMISSQGPSVTA